MYFKDFPQFLYDFNYGNGVIKTDVVKDITRNIRVKKEILSNITIFDEYDIIDGETPEIISEKFYGTPNYHWVIMLANERYDWTTDFPLREDILQKHIASVFNVPDEYPPGRWGVEYTTAPNPRGGHYQLWVIEGEIDETLSPMYMTADVYITLTGQTTDRKFSYRFKFQDPTQSGFDPATGKFYQYLPENEVLLGEPSSDIIVTTENREHNPVYFVNADGYKVNAGSPGAIPVTGDQEYRKRNDEKRRIKIVSPTLLETVIKNYEELLR